MTAGRFSPTDRRILGFLSVLLAGGMVFNLYEKNSRSVSPVLLFSITEVPPRAFSAPPQKNQRPVFASVDLNRAGVEEFERLPGLGPALAERILEYRERKGKYKTVQELLRVPGIGPRKLAQIQSRVYVSSGAVQPDTGVLRGATRQISPDRPSDVPPESSSVFPQADRR